MMKSPVPGWESRSDIWAGLRQPDSDQRPGLQRGNKPAGAVLAWRGVVFRFWVLGWSLKLGGA